MSASALRDNQARKDRKKVLQSLRTRETWKRSGKGSQNPRQQSMRIRRFQISDDLTATADPSAVTNRRTYTLFFAISPRFALGPCQPSWRTDAICRHTSSGCITGFACLPLQSAWIPCQPRGMKCELGNKSEFPLVRALREILASRRISIVVTPTLNAAAQAPTQLPAPKFEGEDHYSRWFRK